MHIFTKVVKRVFLPGLVVVLTTLELKAQQQDSVTSTNAEVVSSSSGKSKFKVTGVIRDASTNKPIDGISISISGYSASITDDKGEFTLPVPHYNAVIVVSGQGYETKEIALKGRNKVSTSLYEAGYVSGYELVKLPFTERLYNSVSGAVKSINVSDSWQRYSESPDTYLQGRVPGLNSVRKSGTPGIGSSMFLRGYNSLYTTHQPLYIVDGILYDNFDYGLSLIAGYSNNPLANIDLKDIDNITVIKDATASAYGSKAANGVVLITTARAQEQATKIDFATYGGINSRVSNIPVMGATDYRSYLSEIWYSKARMQGLSELEAQKEVQSQPFMNEDSSVGDYFSYNGHNTNWQNKVMGNSYNQSYYMKVTGGDNIATYGLALGYLNNKGITNNTSLKRYQTRFNADLNLSRKFKANANLSYVSNDQNVKDQGLASTTNPIYLALTKSPFLSTNEVGANGAQSPNLADYDMFERSNPLAAVDKTIGRNQNYRFNGLVGFDYAFSKQLNLKVLGGVTFSKVREGMFVPSKGIVPDTLSQAVATRRSGSNVERLFSLFTDTRLSYNKSFHNKHFLQANAGFRFSDSDLETDYGLGYNSATDDYITVGTGVSELRRVGGSNGDWNWLNVYGNIDYSLYKKYFLSFNLGVDGSSRFGKTLNRGVGINGNNFGVFPSLSAAWLISSESFMAAAKNVELLKLRASYGWVGNDDIGNYAAQPYYVSQNFLGLEGLVRGNIANTGLGWEAVEKLNVGLDATIFGEKLNVSFDAFKNVTHNMIVLQPVSSITGFYNAYTNSGGMSTTGYELGLSGRVLNRNLKWDMGLNLSTYKNEIRQIPGNRALTEYAGATILTQKGLEGNLFYGYRTSGVYSTSADVTAANVQNRRSDGVVTQFMPGDVRFVDVNGDRFIDEDDRVAIGNPNPDLVGMFSNSLSYKRFSFDAAFTFSLGNDIYNYVRRDLESMSGSQNQLPNVINRWRYEGQTTDVPRAAWGDPNQNSRFSDRWIEDGSYLRLRTLSVAYDVPLKNIALKYAKVYLSGNNVFTISKYLGYDPEFSAKGGVFTQGIDTGFEPQFRTVQLGVRIGL